MKKKDSKALIEKNPEELVKLLVEKRDEVSKAQAEVYAGKQKNLKKSKNLRRDLAQMLTITREKELSKKESEVKEK